MRSYDSEHLSVCPSPAPNGRGRPRPSTMCDVPVVNYIIAAAATPVAAAEGRAQNVDGRSCTDRTLRKEGGRSHAAMEKAAVTLQWYL